MLDDVSRVVRLQLWGEERAALPRGRVIPHPRAQQRALVARDALPHRGDGIHPRHIYRENTGETSYIYIILIFLFIIHHNLESFSLDSVYYYDTPLIKHVTLHSSLTNHRV